MDLTTITTAQFQAKFFRDFPYLPDYSATATYNANKTVYYNGLFYTAIQNGLINILPDSDATKWQLVAGLDPNDYVQTQDITNAFAEAQAVFNQSLFGSNANITLAYLYLTAHYLVNDLRTAAQGVDSTGAFPVSARSVGSMSESYQIPDSYKNNPQLAFFTSSGYGMKFLSLLLPNLVGNVVAVFGGTNP